MSGTKTPCAMCGRTYGIQIPDRPDRCGCCLTGLSIDGRPVSVDPVTQLSRLTGGRCIRLPGDIWSYDMTATATALGLDPSPEAEFARSIRSLLGDWPGYRQVVIDAGLDPEFFAQYRSEKV